LIIIPILLVGNAKLVNCQEMKRICGVHLGTFRLFKFLNVGKILTKGQTKYLRPNQTVKFSQWKRQALRAEFFSVYLGNSWVLYLAVCCIKFCYLYSAAVLNLWYAYTCGTRRPSRWYANRPTTFYLHKNIFI